jgi:hypothetical protein
LLRNVPTKAAIATLISLAAMGTGELRKVADAYFYPMQDASNQRFNGRNAHFQL